MECYQAHYLEDKKFIAKTSVTVVNPEHILNSNHLNYYTESGIAYLYGPSTITNTKDKNKIRKKYEWNSGGGAFARSRIF